MYDDLITKARELCDPILSDEYVSAVYRTLVPQLCDALDSEEKEDERLNDIIASIRNYETESEKQVTRDTKQIKGLLDENAELTARAEKVEAELSALRSPKAAVALKMDSMVQVGHVRFGPGCTIWKCPCCGTFLTPTHKYCLECGQAVSFPNMDLPHGD